MTLLLLRILSSIFISLNILPNTVNGSTLPGFRSSSNCSSSSSSPTISKEKPYISWKHGIEKTLYSESITPGIETIDENCRFSNTSGQGSNNDTTDKLRYNQWIDSNIFKTSSSASSVAFRGNEDGLKHSSSSKKGQKNMNTQLQQSQLKKSGQQNDQLCDEMKIESEDDNIMHESQSRSDKQSQSIIMSDEYIASIQNRADVEQQVRQFRENNKNAHKPKEDQIRYKQRSQERKNRRKINKYTKTQQRLKEKQSSKSLQIDESADTNSVYESDVFTSFQDCLSPESYQMNQTAKLNNITNIDYESLNRLLLAQQHKEEHCQIRHHLTSKRIQNELRWGVLHDCLSERVLQNPTAIQQNTQNCKFPNESDIGNGFISTETNENHSYHNGNNNSSSNHTQSLSQDFSNATVDINSDSQRGLGSSQVIDPVEQTPKDLLWIKELLKIGPHNRDYFNHIYQSTVTQKETQSQNGDINNPSMTFQNHHGTVYEVNMSTNDTNPNETTSLINTSSQIHYQNLHITEYAFGRLIELITFLSQAKNIDSKVITGKQRLFIEHFVHSDDEIMQKMVGLIPSYAKYEGTTRKKQKQVVAKKTRNNSNSNRSLLAPGRADINTFNGGTVTQSQLVIGQQSSNSLSQPCYHVYSTYLGPSHSVAENITAIPMKISQDLLSLNVGSSTSNPYSCRLHAPMKVNIDSASLTKGPLYYLRPPQFEIDESMQQQTEQKLDPVKVQTSIDLSQYSTTQTKFGNSSRNLQSLLVHRKTSDKTSDSDESLQNSQEKLLMVTISKNPEPSIDQSQKLKLSKIMQNRAQNSDSQNNVNKTKKLIKSTKDRKNTNQTHKHRSQSIDSKTSTVSSNGTSTTFNTNNDNIFSNQWDQSSMTTSTNLSQRGFTQSLSSYQQSASTGTGLRRSISSMSQLSESPVLTPSNFNYNSTSAHNYSQYSSEDSATQGESVTQGYNGQTSSSGASSQYSNYGWRSTDQHYDSSDQNFETPIPVYETRFDWEDGVAIGGADEIQTNIFGQQQLRSHNLAMSQSSNSGDHDPIASQKWQNFNIYKQFQSKGSSMENYHFNNQVLAQQNFEDTASSSESMSQNLYQHSLYIDSEKLMPVSIVTGKEILIHLLSKQLWVDPYTDKLVLTPSMLLKQSTVTTIDNNQPDSTVTSDTDVDHYFFYEIFKTILKSETVQDSNSNSNPARESPASESPESSDSLHNILYHLILPEILGIKSWNYFLGKDLSPCGENKVVAVPVTNHVRQNVRSVVLTSPKTNWLLIEIMNLQFSSPVKNSEDSQEVTRSDNINHITNMQSYFHHFLDELLFTMDPYNLKSNQDKIAHFNKQLSLTTTNLISEETFKNLSLGSEESSNGYNRFSVYSIWVARRLLITEQEVREAYNNRNSMSMRSSESPSASESSNGNSTINYNHSGTRITPDVLSHMIVIIFGLSQKDIQIQHYLDTGIYDTNLESNASSQQNQIQKQFIQNNKLNLPLFGTPESQSLLIDGVLGSGSKLVASRHVERIKEAVKVKEIMLRKMGGSV